MLTEGFKGISYPDIQGNLDDYFIINYFGEADYLGMGSSGVPGHIPGAFQFTPYASMGIDQMLNNIPADMPVVVYCWTGQHSSAVVAYLNMLGLRCLQPEVRRQHSVPLRPDRPQVDARRPCTISRWRKAGSSAVPRRIPPW